MLTSLHRYIKWITIPILLIFFWGGGVLISKSYSLKGRSSERGRLLESRPIRSFTLWKILHLSPVTLHPKQLQICYRNTLYGPLGHTKIWGKLTMICIIMFLMDVICKPPISTYILWTWNCYGQIYILFIRACPAVGHKNRRKEGIQASIWQDTGGKLCDKITKTMLNILLYLIKKSKLSYFSRGVRLLFTFSRKTAL